MFNRKFVKKLEQGNCYVHISKSNIIFSLTDSFGNQKTWIRPVNLNFRKTKERISSFAFEKCISVLLSSWYMSKIYCLNVIYSGLLKRWVGFIVNKALKEEKIWVKSFRYKTNKPHGYMRLKKQRRL